MRVAEEYYIQRDSIVDGEGMRDVIFLQGCKHNCAGCHNPRALDCNGGMKRTVDAVFSELMSGNSWGNVTISGGDPFYQSNELCELLRLCKCAGLNIWVYTGFCYEEVRRSSVMGRNLAYIDVLVDGLYVASLRDLTLKFKGSANQRVIDVQKSLKSNRVILYGGY